MRQKNPGKLPPKVALMESATAGSLGLFFTFLRGGIKDCTMPGIPAKHKVSQLLTKPLYFF
jgi:hypothetical protein